LDSGEESDGGCVVRRGGQWNSGIPPDVTTNAVVAIRAARPLTRWVRINEHNDMIEALAPN
jgi:hypothetical protein